MCSVETLGFAVVHMYSVGLVAGERQLAYPPRPDIPKFKAGPIPELPSGDALIIGSFHPIPPGSCC